MNLAIYIEDMERRRVLAAYLGTSPTYLWQIANGWRNRKPSPDFARRIEEATARLGPETVTKEELIFGPAPAKEGEAA